MHDHSAYSYHWALLTHISRLYPTGAQWPPIFYAPAGSWWTLNKTAISVSSIAYNTRDIKEETEHRDICLEINVDFFSPMNNLDYRLHSAHFIPHDACTSLLVLLQQYITAWLDSQSFRSGGRKVLDNGFGRSDVSSGLSPWFADAVSSVLFLL